MAKKFKTIADLIIEYFSEHPNEELQHGPVVDWVEEQYFKRLAAKSPEMYGVPYVFASRGYFNKS